MRLRSARQARVRAGGRLAGATLVVIAVLATTGSGTGARAVPASRPGGSAASTAAYDVYSLPHRLRPLPTASATPAPTPIPPWPVARTLLRTPAPVGRPVSRPPAPTGSASAAAAVFAAINASRAAAGLPALRWSAGLSRSAHLHDLAMAAADQLSHQLAGEAPLATRISAQGVPWSWVGENCGLSPSLSTSGALGLEQMMVNETPPNDGHRLNILTTVGTMVGVDVVFDTLHHRLWLTEDFAN
jgi:uncharacterized protein YkwD